MDENTWVGRRSIETKIVDRVQGDPSLRDELTRDPKAFIERELGEPLPTGVAVRVVEETPNRVFLVLPPADLAG